MITLLNSLTTKPVTSESIISFILENKEILDPISKKIINFKNFYVFLDKSIDKNKYIETIYNLFRLCNNNKFNSNLKPMDPLSGKELDTDKIYVSNNTCYNALDILQLSYPDSIKTPEISRNIYSIVNDELNNSKSTDKGIEDSAYKISNLYKYSIPIAFGIAIAAAIALSATSIQPIDNNPETGIINNNQNFIYNNMGNLTLQDTQTLFPVSTQYLNNFSTSSTLFENTSQINSSTDYEKTLVPVSTQYLNILVPPYGYDFNNSLILSGNTTNLLSKDTNIVISYINKYIIPFVNTIDEFRIAMQIQILDTPEYLLNRILSLKIPNTDINNIIRDIALKITNFPKKLTNTIINKIVPKDFREFFIGETKYIYNTTNSSWSQNGTNANVIMFNKDYKVTNVNITNSSILNSLEMCEKNNIDIHSFISEYSETTTINNTIISVINTNIPTNITLKIIKYNNIYKSDIGSNLLQNITNSNNPIIIGSNKYIKNETGIYFKNGDKVNEFDILWFFKDKSLIPNSIYSEYILNTIKYCKDKVLNIYDYMFTNNLWIDKDENDKNNILVIPRNPSHNIQLPMSLEINGKTLTNSNNIYYENNNSYDSIILDNNKTLQYPSLISYYSYNALNFVISLNQTNTATEYTNNTKFYGTKKIDDNLLILINRS